MITEVREIVRGVRQVLSYIESNYGVKGLVSQVENSAQELNTDALKDLLLPADFLLYENQYNSPDYGLLINPEKQTTVEFSEGQLELRIHDSLQSAMIYLVRMAGITPDTDKEPPHRPLH